MKKLVLFAAVLASLAFVSCGKGKTDVVDTTAQDTTMVTPDTTSMSVDTVKVDTTAVK